MAMKHNGLAKLCEECGELTQVIGKMLQYPELQETCSERHPDGTILRHRIEEELGDVIAAVEFVTQKLSLNREAIDERMLEKSELFETWSTEP